LRIDKVIINDFGKFENFQAEFHKGLNVVYGSNEAGKSTLLAFIKGMLYYLDKKEQKRYIPWGKKEFGAVNKISYTMDNGQSYEVEKNFNRSTVSIYMANPYREVTALYPVSKGNVLFAEEQTGLSLLGFQSSVLIEQSCIRVQSKNNKEMIERLIRLSKYGNENVDYNNAIKRLNELKDQIGLGSTGKYKKLVRINKIIDDLQQKKERARENIRRIQTLQKSISELDLQLQAVQKEMEELLWIRQYQSSQALQHYAEMKKKTEMLYDRKRHLEQQLSLYEGLSAVTPDDMEAVEQQYHLFKALNEQSGVKAESRKMWNKSIGIAVVAVLLAVVGILGRILIQKNISWPFYILCALLFAGIGVIYGYFLRSKYKSEIKNQKEFNQARQLLCSILAQAGYPCSTPEDIDIAVHEFKQGYNARLEIISQIKNCELELNVLNEHIEIAGRVFNYQSNPSMNEKEMMKYQELAVKYALGEDFTANQLEVIIGEKRAKLMQYGELMSANKKELEILSKDYVHPGDIEEQLDMAVKEKQYYEDTREAVNIAIDFLEQSLKEVQENYSPVLNKHLSSILGSITAGKYSNTDTGTDLEIVVHDLKNGILHAEQLSQGTIDQIYFALRVAFAEMLSGKETLPLIIDEAFVQYDDERLLNTLSLLAELAETRQIIIFTCQKREMDMLNRLNASFRKISL